jgi:diguanylate cyclase (GGDEF)-like protein/PAS domain S-box-containing protein
MDIGVQVSERQRIAEALEESERRFHLLADGAPVGIFQTDSRGRCLFVNRRWLELTGQELEQAQGGGWARAVHPEDRERVVTAWNEAAHRGDEFALECRVLHSDGPIHWVFARGCPVRDAEGRLTGYLGTVTAIDEVKRAEHALERSERRYRHLVESSLGLICTHDFEGRLLSVNPAAAKALGYEAEEMVGRNLRDLLAPSVRDRFDDYLRRIRSEGETTGWMRIRTRSGEERLWAYRNSVYEEEGEPLYVLGHAHDITELHRAEQAGRLLAIQDEVTGLLNRRGFERVLENHLVRAAEQETSAELVLINPDEFDVVNDRFGHEIGDRALQEIARALAGFESGASAVCRYGGAVFALVREIPHGTEDPEDLRTVESLRSSLSCREYLGATVRFGFSVGIARFDPRRDGISDDMALHLVRRADEALQQAKMDGGDRAVVWTPEVESEQSGFRDRLSGIFTADLAKDYRNMLLLWDTVTVVARNPDLEELTEKVLEGLRASFKTERVGLFTDGESSSPRLVRGLLREPGTWDLGPEELALIERAGRQRRIQHATGPLEAEPEGSAATPGTEDARRVCFAIPLIARGECLGSLYLDGRADLVRLDASDLVFLEALAERLAVAFARAERVEEDRRRQAAERRRLREEIDGLSQALQRAKLVVRSPQMEKVLDKARRVAPTNATVLIHGPSGTGKEVLARTLHELSPRRGKPPVVVDCTAIAPSLIESELFGHERGAFTGADQRRSGRLAEAEGSTLILDEIGELPRSVQSKLLRFVQEQELMTVGGRRLHKVDTRVIALTHRDLAAEVAAGRFREDLFHRLNVVRLTVPPLAERPDDIRGLARHFVRVFSSQHHKQIRGLTEEAEAALLDHPWPGNVRELQNRILRAVILHSEGWIRPEDLGLGPDPETGDDLVEAELSEPAHAPLASGEEEGPREGLWSRLRDALAAHSETALADGLEQRYPLGRWVQEDLVLEAMEGAGSQREAAESLGIPETTFRRRLIKARAEMDSGRAVRSPRWGEVRRILRDLIHRPPDPKTRAEEAALPQIVRSETALPERLRLLLLQEVESRVDGSVRRGATLLGVTEPTYRRWVEGT